MGWPFGGKDKATEEPATPSEKPSPTQASTVVESTPSTTKATDKAQQAIEEQPELPATAVFEFGGSAVVAGVQMKGICMGDDPDQIRACLWRVDPVEKSTPADVEKYEILF